MSKQNKILTAVLSSIVALLIAIVSIVSVNLAQTTKAAANSGITYYTEEEVNKAYDDGYMAGVGDKEAYEKKIAELQQTIIDNDLAWQTKYNDMVNKYETEIKRLNSEIARLNEYCRTLESYIVDFNFDIDGLTNSKAALELQIAAYESIADGLRSDIAHWTTTLNNLPENLDSERAQIESYTLQIDELERQYISVKMYSVIYEIATEWYDKSSVSANSVNYDSERVFLCPDGITRVLCSDILDYLKFNYGFREDITLYFKNDLFALSAVKNQFEYDQIAYSTFVGFPSISESMSNASADSIPALIIALRDGYFSYSGIISPEGFGSVIISSMIPFFTCFRDYELPKRNEEVKMLTSQINSVKSLRNSTQDYIDDIIEQKAVANHIITTAQSSLETVNTRIAELRELIATL